VNWLSENLSHKVQSANDGGGHLDDGRVATLPLTLASVTETCAARTNRILDDRITFTAQSNTTS